MSALQRPSVLHTGLTARTLKSCSSVCTIVSTNQKRRQRAQSRAPRGQQWYNLAKRESVHFDAHQPEPAQAQVPESAQRGAYCPV